MAFFIFINASFFIILVLKIMQGFTNSPFKEVPTHFSPQGNTHYRIVSIQDPSKAFTVGNDGSLSISTYTGINSQRFVIVQQGHKYALIVQSTSTALCIYFDNRDNGGLIKSDPGQHDSSWFEINRVPSGEYANRGYAIGTFVAGRCAAIDGGVAKEGIRVIQWEWHTGAGQIWLIVPADQPLHNNQGQGQWGTQNQGWGQQSNSWGQQNQGWGTQSQGAWGNKSQNAGNKNNNQNQGWGTQSEYGKNKKNKVGQGQQGQWQPQGQGFGMEMVGQFKKGYTYCFISAGDEKKCIHISQDNYAKVSSFQATVNQKFTFQYYDPEFRSYYIKCVGNGQFLSAGGLFAGVPVVTKPKSQWGEQWTVELSTKFPKKNNAIAYVLRSCSGHAIDVPGENYSNNNQLEKHGFHGKANQVWYIVEM